MTPAVDRMIDDLIRRAGGFVDHPLDRGGPTDFGITRATLSRHLGRPASADDLRRLDRGVARKIYRRECFQRPRLDRLPPGIRLEELDVPMERLVA